MTMILNGKTDIGRRRKNNQDSFVIRQYEGAGYALGLVCDGMGGANGGNIASALASERFVACVEKFLNAEGGRARTATEGDISLMLAHAVADANHAVFRASGKDESLKGMGTTLVAALVVGGTLYAVNVGDSRLYLFAHGKLTQITRDHSLVQYLVDAGKITATEAKTYPNRNVITRAVGIEKNIEADIFSVDVRDLGPDACALLCSDGLSGYVDGQKMIDLLSGEEPYDGDRVATALIDAANEAGGTDNITVVLMRLSGDEATTSNTAGSASEDKKPEEGTTV